ncbi:DUF1737 domain-containing protein [Dyadobacter sediminis]|uniref:DUF1737 domain-containing protein n=1 Tax=Dyadobacter sediminis TaxID=1493691 RepID=A0A5R9KBN1_9BACT|nr:DUF1737 domain-containing protein [Dyadobacter sediminis]TLU92168.1 DUF1737 domain-containing protein [Dyadobacter sediminis]GGB96850.1 hypothetical protein GCM10011325_25220 [Dyadobacter sediminis]
MKLKYNIRSSEAEDAVKYLIVESNDMSKLAVIVNDYIKKGWLPLGGVGVNQKSELASKEYTQALTKMEDMPRESS